MNKYVYALTVWNQFGGDERLSVKDALDKANSSLDEMITVAKQVDITILSSGRGKCYI